MSRIIRCDRCGADITGGGVGYISWNWRDVNTDDLIDGNPFEKNDYCTECMGAVKQFVTEPCQCEHIPEVPAEKIAEPKETPEPPEDNEDEKEPDPEEDGSDEITATLNRLLSEPKPDKEKKAIPERKSVDLKKLQELVREGKKPPEIAKYFGISVGSYYNYRKKAEELYISGNL